MDDLTGNDDEVLASISTTRLYGGTIAIVSGLYSIFLSTMGMDGSPLMDGSPTGLVMLILGVVVAAHGLVLFTEYAARIRKDSGMLMVSYAALMLLLQAWLPMQAPADGMNGMNGTTSAAAMSDPGMVAIALIMLASGLIMNARMDEM